MGFLRQVLMQFYGQYAVFLLLSFARCLRSLRGKITWMIYDSNNNFIC